MTETLMYNPGDIGYILYCSASAFLMIPGLGLFYSGLIGKKNALSVILISILSCIIITLQWYLFGYSLALSRTGTWFIGDLKNMLLIGVDGFEPSFANEKLPSILFVFFQSLFASITPAVVIGAGAERQSIFSTCVFMFLWSFFAYDFIACWTWSEHGWAAQLGVLDYAGGTPVHIASGFSALVYATLLGKRRGYDASIIKVNAEKSNKDEIKTSIKDEEVGKPHNLLNIVLGTSILWFGWFAFNGGSALSPNMKAVLSTFNTNLAACSGGVSWLLMDYFISTAEGQKGKWSIISLCSGVISGLVGITPAAGFVNTSAAIFIGLITAVMCNLTVKFKHLIGFDDSVDVFAVHGMGGIVGCLLTGVFARKHLVELHSAVEVLGGWIDGNYIQLLKQLVSISATALWTSAVSFVILIVMNSIPVLQLRASPLVEDLGLDLLEMGEIAYPDIQQDFKLEDWCQKLSLEK